MKSFKSMKADAVALLTRYGSLDDRISASSPYLVFTIFFLLCPVLQFHGFLRIAGDIGDARFNNYILEHIYQFLFGHVTSFLHPQFFSPFPYIIGFSDNLLGASPIYIVARFITGEPDTAFQAWYYFQFIANYFSAYHSLRMLKLSKPSAALGAAIFAFALPVSSRSGHAQLHYRFGVPLAVSAFILFLESKDWRKFVQTMFWTVWQFYCTIYIGFFLLVILCCIAFSSILLHIFTSQDNFQCFIQSFVSSWLDISKQSRRNMLIITALLFILMVILFYPYIAVSLVYGFRRPWNEILSMLPSPKSYFLADYSVLWRIFSKGIKNIPMRHELAMFCGLIPIISVPISVVFYRFFNKSKYFNIIFYSFIIVFAITLNIDGYTLWYFIAKLPLASAIRAVARIDLVLLFLFAFLTANILDRVREKHADMEVAMYAIIALILLIDFAATRPSAWKKTEWRERLAVAEEHLPKELPENPILFMSQARGPAYAADLDAMWVAMNHNIETLNGYSGWTPPGALFKYGTDRNEASRRVRSFMALTDRSGDEAFYETFMKRIIFVDFDNSTAESAKVN